MTTPETLAQLEDRIAGGWQPKFVFFWGHTAAAGTLGKECFSQWYPAPFELDGAQFATAEHYMMWSKARLFDDSASASKILDAGSPAAAKALGREVQGFVNETWEAHRSEVVFRANVAKFSQNAELGRYLLGTGERVLVEASPTDRIWGIGLAADHAHATDPSKWRGLNLLGFALMRARNALDR